MLVVVSNVGLGDGDGQDAAEVGQPLLVETLDHARQVGDALQLDHLLQTHTVTESGEKFRDIQQLLTPANINTFHRLMKTQQ